MRLGKKYQFKKSVEAIKIMMMKFDKKKTLTVIKKKFKKILSQIKEIAIKRWGLNLKQ